MCGVLDFVPLRNTLQLRSTLQPRNTFQRVRLMYNLNPESNPVRARPSQISRRSTSQLHLRLMQRALGMTLPLLLLYRMHGGKRAGHSWEEEQARTMSTARSRVLYPTSRSSLLCLYYFFYSLDRLINLLFTSLIPLLYDR